jgi:hypothetical protein
MRFCSLVLALTCCAGTAAAADPTTFVSPRVADREVSVENLAVQGGVTTAELVNHASHPIRDIVVVVQYKYQWPREFAPGKQSPGHGEVVTIPETVPPGGSYAFRLPDGPPPTPAQGGHFDTVVRVISFDELVPPGA